MKKLTLLIPFFVFFLNTYAQKKYSLGLNAVLYTSNSKNQAKNDLFLYNVLGSRVDFRKNTFGLNFLTVSAETVVSNKNLYSYQNLKFGYEVGNVFNIKNLFLTTEIGIGRFNSKLLNKSTITFAPSLGSGYNIYLSKRLLLRPYNSLTLQIPTKVVSILGNFGIGLHYCFGENKKENN